MPGAPSVAEGGLWTVGARLPVEIGRSWVGRPMNVVYELIKSSTNTNYYYKHPWPSWSRRRTQDPLPRGSLVRIQSDAQIVWRSLVYRGRFKPC